MFNTLFILVNPSSQASDGFFKRTADNVKNKVNNVAKKAKNIAGSVINTVIPKENKKLEDKNTSIKIIPTPAIDRKKEMKDYMNELKSQGLPKEEIKKLLLEKYKQEAEKVIMQAPSEGRENIRKAKNQQLTRLEGLVNREKEIEELKNLKESANKGREMAMLFEKKLPAREEEMNEQFDKIFEKK